MGNSYFIPPFEKVVDFFRLSLLKQDNSCNFATAVTSVRIIVYEESDHTYEAACFDLALFALGRSAAAAQRNIIEMCKTFILTPSNNYCAEQHQNNPNNDDTDSFSKLYELLNKYSIEKHYYAFNSQTIMCQLKSSSRRRYGLRRRGASTGCVLPIHTGIINASRKPAVPIKPLGGPDED